MKRVALAGLGVVVGFGAALGVMSAKGADDASAYRQLDLFSDAFERVRANYVRPVQDRDLISAAIQGMVSDLDPHSAYMDPKSYGDMQITTRGQFGGVGIEVTQEEGLIKVISPIDGTPAAKAGIKSGDKIGAIDGVSIMGLPMNDAIDKMRGPAGSRITLTVIREGEKKPFDVQLQRAIVQVGAINFRREGNVGYIRMPGFNQQTAAGLERAVRERRIAGAQDHIRAEVGVQLLFHRLSDVDLGEHTEALLLERGPGAFDGLIIRRGNRGSEAIGASWGLVSHLCLLLIDSVYRD